MRAPHHGDAVSAARVLLGVQPSRRAWVLARMLREADLAEARVRLGQGAHPIWGDGALMSAALRRRPLPEPPLSDGDYCGCLGLVFIALARRGRQPRAHETQSGAVGSRSSRAAGMASPQSWQ